MRHLRVVIDVQLVAVFLGKPLPGESQARVDPNTLVGNLNRIVRRLVGNLKALFSKCVNTSRARRAELSGELLVSLDPFIDCRSTWHPAVFANARERLTL
jgi:hypothetical protein